MYKVSFSHAVTCSLFVWTLVFTVDPMVCHVKWEFYYLFCTLLWESLSYPVLENSLGEGNSVFCSCRMGELSGQTSVSERRNDWKWRIRSTHENLFHWFRIPAVLPWWLVKVEYQENLHNVLQLLHLFFVLFCVLSISYYVFLFHHCTQSKMLL